MTTKYQEPGDVPNDVLCTRLEELAEASQHRLSRDREFTMRVPAEVDRDADIVLTEAAKRIRAFINT